IYSLEQLIRFIYPLPSGVNFDNPESARQAMSRMPACMFIVLLCAHEFGSFIAGLAASLLSGRGTSTSSLIAGALVMLVGIWGMVVIYPPLWYVITSIPLYIPFAYLGYRVVRKKM
ncbi:MAG TPA: hypothetical protein VFA55_10360, partial [Candidatus Kapabacteria bacterium]|nr:hypothetical protein [Candidatus Kapabacteria bacterium]